MEDEPMMMESDLLRLNPMNIPSIVDTILETLVEESPYEVIKCRQLSHLWNQEATKILQKESKQIITLGLPLTLHWNKDLATFLHTFGSNGEFGDNNNNNRMKPRIPSTHFELLPSAFSNEKELRAFFKLVAPIVKSLFLILDIRSPVEFDSNVEITPKLLQLTKLSIEFRRFQESDATLVQTILTNGNTILESLNLIYPPTTMAFHGEEIQSKITQRLTSTFNTVSLPLLKELTLDILLTNELLSSLSVLATTSKLNSVQLSIRDATLDKETLFHLFEKLAPYLKQLVLQRLTPKTNIVFKFPVMSHLTRLEFQGWETLVTNIEFSEFSYSVQFPKLESLHFNTWSENESWKQFFPSYLTTDDTMRLNVRHLKLPSAMSNPTAILDSYAFFLNVKSMTLNFSLKMKPLLTKVFQMLGNSLRVLTLCRSCEDVAKVVCIDDLFTGVKINDCEQMLRRKSYDDVLIKRREPSLLNLKKLHKLDMSDLLINSLLYITDVTGYGILMKLENLQTLHMNGSKLSLPCLQELARK